MTVRGMFTLMLWPMLATLNRIVHWLCCTAVGKQCMCSQHTSNCMVRTLTASNFFMISSLTIWLAWNIRPSLLQAWYTKVVVLYNVSLCILVWMSLHKHLGRHAERLMTNKQNIISNSLWSWHIEFHKLHIYSLGTSSWNSYYQHCSYYKHCWHDQTSNYQKLSRTQHDSLLATQDCNSCTL